MLLKKGTIFAIPNQVDIALTTIIEYPIETLNGQKSILAEIQIRTLAMNFWSTIEHTLRYKYDGDYPDEIQHRLERAAEAAYLLDEEMSEIKDEIQEAQKYYTQKRKNMKMTNEV